MCAAVPDRAITLLRWLPGWQRSESQQQQQQRAAAAARSRALKLVKKLRTRTVEAGRDPIPAPIRLGRLRCDVRRTRADRQRRDGDGGGRACGGEQR